MTRYPICLTVAFGLSVFLAADARAQEAPQAVQMSQSGSALFKTYCTVCHGPAAKGDGIVAATLRKRPADLTQIEKRNKGVFPVEKIAARIDGRDVVKEHGNSDMPIWGDAFSRVSGETDAATVKAKVEALVKYLQSIQERAATN